MFPKKNIYNLFFFTNSFESAKFNHQFFDFKLRFCAKSINQTNPSPFPRKTNCINFNLMSCVNYLTQNIFPNQNLKIKIFMSNIVARVFQVTRRHRQIVAYSTSRFSCQKKISFDFIDFHFCVIVGMIESVDVVSFNQNSIIAMLSQ